MNLFIYSDESGVFDQAHNQIFVFGGLIFLGKDERDTCARLYSKAESDIRKAAGLVPQAEVKACSISNKYKGKLYRSLNRFHKFGVIVRQNRVLPQVYAHKKTKQRFLDYAYKMAIKRTLIQMDRTGIVRLDEIDNLYFFVDEHTTATDGKYELRESIEQELKFGIFNINYQHFYPPICPGIKSVNLQFCNSAAVTLIRAADIVANHIFYLANTQPGGPQSNQNLHIFRLP